MDTFFEQIVSIKKTGKSMAAVLGISFLTLIISAALFLTQIIGPFTLIAIFALFFGAYKLITLFNIEYEYIITNGTLDIDKIINKSSRKRILSLELSNVSRLEKFTPNVLNTINSKNLTMACDNDNKNAYLLVAEKEGSATAYLVFAPDERLQGAIKKFAPKYIANSAFK